VDLNILNVISYFAAYYKYINMNNKLEWHLKHVKKSSHVNVEILVFCATHLQMVSCRCSQKNHPNKTWMVLCVHSCQQHRAPRSLSGLAFLCKGDDGAIAFLGFFLGYDTSIWSPFLKNINHNHLYIERESCVMLCIYIYNYILIYIISIFIIISI
jgi:hypothetical protein